MGEVWIFIFYLFIYLSIYLFIYLLIYLFNNTFSTPGVHFKLGLIDLAFSVDFTLFEHHTLDSGSDGPD